MRVDIETIRQKAREYAADHKKTVVIFKDKKGFRFMGAYNFFIFQPGEFLEYISLVSIMR